MADARRPGRRVKSEEWRNANEGLRLYRDRGRDHRPVAGAFLKAKEPQSKVLVLEKEEDVARHASGRNSGVLHAGFYYTADSFKARFTVRGNKSMKEYCQQNDIPINECGKIVVAQNEAELKTPGRTPAPWSGQRRERGAD